MLALFHFVQRRLCDVDVAVLEQFTEVTEEERQQQRANVGAVDIGVRHDDDLVIAQLGDILLGADAGTERRDERG